MENKDALAVFESIKADYNKFMNGPVTKRGDPCNCVPCLTKKQIKLLLDISLKTAIEDARRVVSSQPSTNVMVDMAFNLGRTKFLKFKTFAMLVTRQNWKAAGDDLTVSKLCQQVPRRCMENAKVVRQGCDCSQPYPQACDAQRPPVVAARHKRLAVKVR
ncbi:hypothetical protein OS493_028896 [Desmophyllum pertusum]|uniref:Lysozyme n=1 Tax=Desmophyllum pertusum TaxID=174260 RepID=A0A9X0CVU9_9CNID|nr:hypothetical protein OS493_028896 [Desmophyllum pertusum]